jgi:hypothetical protein
VASKPKATAFLTRRLLQFSPSTSIRGHTA